MGQVPALHDTRIIDSYDHDLCTDVLAWLRRLGFDTLLPDNDSLERHPDVLFHLVDPSNGAVGIINGTMLVYSGETGSIDVHLPKPSVVTIKRR